MIMKLLVKTLAVLAVLASPALADGPRSIIVMDGSGSMWGQIDGRAKLEIARETVATVLGSIPADQELGLMAYGHREKGNCSDIELVVPPAPGTGAEIAAQVGKMRFLGKTPLSESVRRAAEALRYGEEAATVVLVTDGLETCNADPCALGRELEAAGLNFTAHVIGFGLTKAEGAQVACLATETGGQYLQASDADALADALSATVTAKLPAPQPLPVPEPVPSLPTASLSAPDTAPAGTVMRVAFEGPHEEFDYIHILDAKGERKAEKVVEQAPYVDIRLPFEIGAYEIAYSYRSSDIIARKALTIVEAPASLNAPETAPAGATIAVEWTGPAAQFDYINLLDAAGARVAEAAIGDENPVMLGLPFMTGDFMLTYLFEGQEVIVSRPITLTEAPVSISAPEMAQAGTEVAITWVGPNATYDNIQLYRQADEERISYQYLGETNQLTFTMPDEPGIYEFRYRFGDAETILVQPITVTLDKVEAAPSAGGLLIVPVQITAPAGFAQQPIQWSAEPLDPHPFAPEALAMPEALAGPWTAELYPGRWRIYGEAPAGATAGQGFAADITVTADAGQSFDIPLAPFETMGMGEDLPSGDTVAVTIKAEGYDGLVDWSAMPEGGTQDDRLADTVANGWQTTLIPGQWAFFGMAADATFFGRVTIAAGQTDYVIPREGPVDPAQASDDVAYRCDAAPSCRVNDAQTGLGFALPAGWFTDFPHFYETAAGVSASQPTIAFMTAVGDRIELNPIRWSAQNGTCLDTAAGQLCHWADATEAVIKAHTAIAASLTFTPTRQDITIPGIRLDLTPEVAAALRAKLLGEN